MSKLTKQKSETFKDKLGSYNPILEESQETYEDAHTSQVRVSTPIRPNRNTTTKSTFEIPRELSDSQK